MAGNSRQVGLRRSFLLRITNVLRVTPRRREFKPICVDGKVDKFGVYIKILSQGTFIAEDKANGIVSMTDVRLLCLNQCEVIVVSLIVGKVDHTKTDSHIHLRKN